jgi:hypothetical protein
MDPVLILMDVWQQRVNLRRLLSAEEMKRVHGGRLVKVTVDGERDAVIDDFELDTAIWEGRIGVKVV